jgi:hypothetical protein
MGRNISDNHLKAYKEEKGAFKQLFSAIKEDPELSFEVRLDNEVMVYYHKDKILTTSFKRDKPAVKILDSKYYAPSTGRKAPSVDMQDKKNWDVVSLWRKYFSEAKSLVYFYKKGAEFSVQQNIALGNQSYDNRFLAVDMEWAFAQSDIDIKDRIPRTRIDLVLVDTIPNEQGLNDIYLAELKVGTVATEGTSGTIDHVEKTFKLINTEKACQDLKEDVTNIINVKSELGIYTGTAKQFNLADKPKMMLILAYRGEEEYKRLLKDSTATQEKAKELGMDEIKVVMHNALIKLD